jgi:hypothetical protein
MIEIPNLESGRKNQASRSLGLWHFRFISDFGFRISHFVCLVAFLAAGTCSAGLPNPILNTVFPAGGSVGKTVEVTIAGGGLNGLSALRCATSGITFEQDDKDKNKFRVNISPEVPPGVYDLRAVCDNGLSSPRPFVIGNRAEQLEAEPNEESSTAQSAPLNGVINGRIEKAGDLDHFNFDARQGQRVVIECWAERIDSRLRAVLEVFDSKGRRLASNRGYFGVDPLIDFLVPADGQYIVKLYDLIYSGGAEHYYRLDIDTGPRVAFAVPAVVEQGKPARVTLYGWNLSKEVGQVANLPETTEESRQVGNLAHEESDFERIEVEIPAEMARAAWPLPVQLQPSQAAIRGFAFQLSGGHAPVFIGVTDVPVETDKSDNHSPNSAQQLSYPCEVSGQLVAGDEQDWFAIDARRGEVLYIEGFAQRIHSPADLDVRVLDATGEHELIQFGDEIKNVGGQSFPTNHLDPSGRWVVPDDGRYSILVRNLIGGQHSDPRRTYRLCIRREEPDFGLAVVPHRGDPAGVNISRGGRTILDVIATRRRGLTGAIQVTARDLPNGIECPDVWLGPGVDRTTLVVSADRDASDFVGNLKLEGSAEMTAGRAVRGGVVVRSGLPSGWGRLTSDIPLAVAGESPICITANGNETRDHQLYGELKIRHSPGGILDVAVHVERNDTGHQAPVKLIGVGLPELIENQTAEIPAGSDKGYISFYLPPSLPVGRYSLAVRGQTTVPTADKKKNEAVTIYTNVVSFDVHPPAFRVEVDRYAPRSIKRGQVVQVNYTAKRVNGFINKIHTELASPGKVTDVVGLRGRGVTFVGQTESGTIQIIANDDAPLGQQPFLRLYGVGVLEDEAIFHGSCFLSLEVVE